MSEMFTKCNGFIVSGDPLVYADSATMTGQGTVSEPFGVKSTDLFVQEPLYTGVSGNSAYIGWNNETVLFSSNSGGVTAGSFNENLTNFEYIDFYYNRTGTTNPNLAGHTRIAIVDNVIPTEIMCQAGLHTSTADMFATVEYFNLTDSTFTWNAGYNLETTSTGYPKNIIMNFKNFGFTKIVGINRKV